MGHNTVSSKDSTHIPVIVSSIASPSTTANNDPEVSMTRNNDAPEEHMSKTDRTEEEGTGSVKQAEGEGSDSDDASKRPPLPMRPSTAKSEERPATSRSTLGPMRPQLQSKPTTQLSSIDIQTLSFPDGTRGNFTSEARSPSGQTIPELRSKASRISRNGSEVEDIGSLMSPAPTLRATGDLESLLGDALTAQSPAWRMLSTHVETGDPFENPEEAEPNDGLSTFSQEFDEMEEVDSKGGNEGMLYMSDQGLSY